MLEWEDELSMMTPSPSQDAVAPHLNPETPTKRTSTQGELSSTLNPQTPSPQRTVASQARLAAILRAQEESRSESETTSNTIQSTQNNVSSSPSSSHTPPAATSQMSQKSPYLPSWCSQKPFPAMTQPTTPPSAVKQTTLDRREELPVASPPPAVAPQINPQTPSKRPASINEHELTPPHKRSNIAPPTPSPQRTAASQARLAAILRAQGQVPLESEASTSTLQSTSTSSLLPMHPIQASPTSFQPTTPPPTAEQTERHWPPQTPPSIRTAVTQSASGQVGRTIQFSSSPRNGTQNYLGASENVPLDDPFDCPSGTVTGSGGSEPRGPVALSDAEEMSVSDQYLDYSNQVAQYIKLLERRLQVAEKSNEDKARRIGRLNEEVDRLKAHNKELESALTKET
ncbi:hypothetical protein C8R45DRAFT_102044 [Mycena sanguinolenta]|nr:hypothetical protein C8R45DRAFT_102044 [Mycena sanguinolenta]